MARSLDAILAELNPQYAGSENIINARLNAIPGEIDAGISQADARLSQANDSILNGARRRGTGVAFGGIPLAEQSKYAATEYAPAIANLKASSANKELTLQESLQQLGRDKRNQAQSLYQNELDRDFQQQQFNEQVRQFNEQMAAQERARRDAAAASYSFGNSLGSIGGQASGGTSAAARITKTNNGYGFTDGAGRPINAYQYSQLTGTGYRQLLSQMAKDGDKNSQIALQYVGDNGKFGNAPASVAGALSAVGASGSLASTQQPERAALTSALKANSNPVIKGYGLYRSLFPGYN